MSAGVPQHGLVEILAQRMDLRWFGNDGGSHCREVLVPPRAISNAGASCLFTAVNTGVPAFSVDGLTYLSARMPFLIFYELPGNAASCKKKLWATHKLIPESVFYILSDGARSTK